MSEEIKCAGPSKASNEGAAVDEVLLAEPFAESLFERIVAAASPPMKPESPRSAAKDRHLRTGSLSRSVRHDDPLVESQSAD